MYSEWQNGAFEYTLDKYIYSFFQQHYGIIKWSYAIVVVITVDQEIFTVKKFSPGASVVKIKCPKILQR